MQFRMRHGKLEFLRSSYDPKKGRSRQKMVPRSDLTAEEIEELRVWQRKTDAERRAEEGAAVMTGAPTAVNEIAEALENGYGHLNEAALFEALDRLRKAMRKIGIKRSVKLAKQQNAQTAPLDLG